MLKSSSNHDQRKKDGHVALGALPLPTHLDLLTSMPIGGGTMDILGSETSNRNVMPDAMNMFHVDQGNAPAAATAPAGPTKVVLEKRVAAEGSGENRSNRQLKSPGDETTQSTNERSSTESQDQKKKLSPMELQRIKNLQASEYFRRQREEFMKKDTPQEKTPAELKKSKQKLAGGDMAILSPDSGGPSPFSEGSDNGNSIDSILFFFFFTKVNQSLEIHFRRV